MGIFSNPDNFEVGSNGFANPLSGGSVGVLGGTIEFDDVGAKNLGEIPENAIPVMLIVSVETDFDAGTNNNLDVGLTSDGDYFADDMAIGTQANYLPDATGMIAGRYGVKLGAGEQLTAEYVQSGTAATTGKAHVILFYILAGETVVMD